MTELEQALGYEFKDRALLTRALTHSSWANERGAGRSACNERLEFLGDSILGFVVAEALYRRGDLPEGTMTRMRAELVCEGSLVKASEKLRLGHYLRLGKGEELSGGRTRPSMIADAFEAVLAAIYMDGGEAAARALLDRMIRPNIQTATVNHDYKTLLQEAVQREGRPSPVYRLVAESGPDHNKRFTIQVFCGDQVAGEGVGRSKKEAEQEAARAAYAPYSGT